MTTLQAILFFVVVAVVAFLLGVLFERERGTTEPPKEGRLVIPIGPVRERKL